MPRSLSSATVDVLAIPYRRRPALVVDGVDATATSGCAATYLTISAGDDEARLTYRDSPSIDCGLPLPPDPFDGDYADVLERVTDGFQTTSNLTLEGPGVRLVYDAVLDDPG